MLDVAGEFTLVRAIIADHHQVGFRHDHAGAEAGLAVCSGTAVRSESAISKPYLFAAGMPPDDNRG